MGLISEAQFEEALASGKKSGKRIGRTLIDSGLVTEEAIAQALSSQYEIPFIKLEGVIIDPQIIRMVPEGLARKHLVIPLSLEFVEAGAPVSSYYQTLGEFLYYGVNKTGYDIHGLFFCLGGILWYYLFYKSRYIPRVLSVWGLATVCPILIYGLLTLYDRNLEPAIPLMIFGAPYIVFEALIGPWLMVKGIRDGSETS